MTDGMPGADMTVARSSKDVVSGWLSDYAEILKGRISDTEISPKDWESANQRLTEIVLYLRAAPETRVNVEHELELAAFELKLGLTYDPFSSRPRYLFILDAIDLLMQQARPALKASEHLDPLCNCPVDSWGIVGCQEDSGIVRCRAEVNAENGNVQP